MDELRSAQPRPLSIICLVISHFVWFIIVKISISIDAKPRLEDKPSKFQLQWLISPSNRSIRTIRHRLPVSLALRFLLIMISQLDG